MSNFFKFLVPIVRDNTFFKTHRIYGKTISIMGIHAIPQITIQAQKQYNSKFNLKQSNGIKLGFNSSRRYFHYGLTKDNDDNDVINEPITSNPEQIVRAPSSGINPEEDQYLDLMHNILVNGNQTNDRTNTGVHSIFGAKLVYNLRTGFPLITSKKMFWKGVVTELLWLLKGNTNAKDLAAQGNHIWDKDTSREKLDERGMFHLQEGDCGATYGFNLRHFGTEYKTCNENYKGLGVDQLANCITTLKTNPTDRRIILNLWNPTTLNNCSLPPCLFCYCLYVANGELSCFTVARSGDLCLGTPFNVASSALLTHILANMTDLQVGHLHYNCVNSHIYKTHINGAKEQLLRPVHPKCQLQMPQIQIGENKFVPKKLTLENIDLGEVSWKDFKLIGYQSEGPLTEKLIMAA
jgi:thymidylate synthase